MKKGQSTFEYRLDQATSFQDARGRDVLLPANTRLIYGGYDPEGFGVFTVTAGKENGRKVQTDGLPAASFRGGAADTCRSCGTALTTENRSIMVTDLCAACEDAGSF